MILSRIQNIGFVGKDKSDKIRQTFTYQPLVEI